MLWDDHEVHDNWYPTRSLEGEAKYHSRACRSSPARARQAFFEYNPLPLRAGRPGTGLPHGLRYGRLLEVFALDLRSYRGANSENRQTSIDEGVVADGRAPSSRG